jgi:GrpB-like predicted nucleotidyltransferase (UPF0157 family)
VFGRLAAELAARLGNMAVAIEHVGSTAVPGLVAKPIVDIAIGLASGADPDVAVAALLPLGYQLRGDKGDEGGGCWSSRTGPHIGSRIFIWSDMATRNGDAGSRCATG